MPTQIIFADSDGYVSGSDAVYATARSTGGTALTGGMDVGQTLGAGIYRCKEGLLSFDTTLTSNPLTATLSLNAPSGSSDHSGTDFTIEARLYDWGTTVTIGDYVAGASISQPLLATYDTVNGWGFSYHDFTDVALLANLVLGGFTRMLLNSDRHRLGTAPPSPGDEYVNVASVSSPGTSLDPKLTIVGDVGNQGTPGPVPDDDNVLLPWQQIVAS